MTADPAAQLGGLAERVSRNVALRRDPERFHVEKSCIAQDLEHLANEIDERASASRVGAMALTVSRQKRPVTVQRERGPFFTSTK